MSKQRLLTIFNIVTLSGLILLASFTIGKEESRIGFVDVDKLVDSYEGTREAVALFELKTKPWNLKIDSLEQEIRVLNDNYLQKISLLDETEVREIFARSKLKMDQLNSKREALLKNKAELEEELMLGVMQRVDKEVADFAKKEGIEIILGLQGDGNVLYGAESRDFTDELVYYLNETF